MNRWRYYEDAKALFHQRQPGRSGAFEEQLEAAGISAPQIHVLSCDDADVEHHHHLHAVQSFMKNDVVHSTERGAVLGLCAFVLVLAIAYFAGWTESAVGWMPFIFLAVVMLGFCTWEGGLLESRNPTTTSRVSNKP